MQGSFYFKDGNIEFEFCKIAGNSPLLPWRFCRYWKDFDVRVKGQLYLHLDENDSGEQMSGKETKVSID